MKKSFILPVLIASLFVQSTIDAADYEYKISLGGSFATLNSSLQANANTNDGNKSIDFEDDLGMDESIDFTNFSLETKINDNHRFYITVMPTSRTAQIIIEDSIEFENDTLLFNTEINSRFRNTMIDLRYGYRFRTSENAELELVAGIYWMRNKFNIKASGNIENELGEINFNTDYEKQRSIGLPLPLLGIGYRYNLNEKWTIIGSARYFSASYNNISGAISSLLFSAEYNPSKNWGIGTALSYLNIDSSLDRPAIAGKLDWQYTGLNAYIFYNF